MYGRVWAEWLALSCRTRLRKYSLIWIYFFAELAVLRLESSKTAVTLTLLLRFWWFSAASHSHVPTFSSLDKDQIKVVIDEVTRWLDLAEEGDWMTLPGIAGRLSPSLGCWGW